RESEVELAREVEGEVARRLEEGQGDVEAELLQVALEDLGDLRALRRAGRDEEVELGGSSREAPLGEEVLGPGEVEAELLVELRVVRRSPRGGHLHGRLPHSAQDGPGDALPVERVAERLADLEGVEGRASRVHDQDVVLVRHGR